MDKKSGWDRERGGEGEGKGGEGEGEEEEEEEEEEEVDTLFFVPNLFICHSVSKLIKLTGNEFCSH